VSVAVGTLTAASAGCSSTSHGPSAPDSSIQHVTVLGNDNMRFVPSHLTVHPGTVQITLRDVGSEAHNIDFPSLDVKSPLIPGGHSTTVTIHVQAHHTYNFDCDIHISEGMIGTLTVS
jgi:plastocyanin